MLFRGGTKGSLLFLFGGVAYRAACRFCSGFRISAIGGMLGQLAPGRSRTRVPFMCRDHEAAELSG